MRLSSFEQACARSCVLSARPSIQSDARVSVRTYVYYINDRVFFFIYSNLTSNLLCTCARMHVCVCASQSISLSVSTFVHQHVRLVRPCLHTYVNACVSPFLRVWVRICVCICQYQ